MERQSKLLRGILAAIVGGWVWGGGGLADSWGQPPGAGGDTIVKANALELRPLVLDFKNSHSLVPLPASFPADRGEYLLQIPSLDSLAAEARLRNRIGEAVLGQAVVIEFVDMAGVELHLRLVRSAADALAIDVKHLLEKGLSPGFGLSYSRLERAQIGLSRSLAEGQQLIPLLERDVATLKSSLQLLAWLPVRNRYEATQREVFLGSMRLRLQRVDNRLQDERRQVKDCQEKLALIPLVMEFIDSIHDSQIPYRVLLRRNGSAIELLDGTNIRHPEPSRVGDRRSNAVTAEER